MIRDIRIQQTNFDPGAELARIETSGAVASFTGLVRGDGGLTAMTLEHYPGMTEAALVAIAAEAEARWLLTGLILVHRVGQLAPGDRIVLVATASPHRAAALEACTFLIDRLKTDAPFWKKESFADGRENWVDARESDEEAAGRWALSTQSC
jgi:molybdopterin synthase catalytic subunit